MSRARRLAAILAAGVAGYSRLMGAEERERTKGLKAHRRAMRYGISAGDGRSHADIRNS
jgi:hypothetical protein